MKPTPIKAEVVNEVIDAFGIHPAGKSTIRELVKIVNDIEGITGEEFIRMEIFNILGQRVRMLVANMYPTGSYRVWWDGKNDEGGPLGSGIYILYFNAGDFIQKRRMVLLK